MKASLIEPQALVNRKMDADGEMTIVAAFGIAPVPSAHLLICLVLGAFHQKIIRAG
jgi:hypothetical protein